MVGPSGCHPAFDILFLNDQCPNKCRGCDIVCFSHPDDTGRGQRSPFSSQPDDDDAIHGTRMTFSQPAYTNDDCYDSWRPPGEPRHTVYSPLRESRYNATYPLDYHTADESDYVRTAACKNSLDSTSLSLSLISSTDVEYFRPYGPNESLHFDDIIGSRTDAVFVVPIEPTLPSENVDLYRFVRLFCNLLIIFVVVFRFYKYGTCGRRSMRDFGFQNPADGVIIKITSGVSRVFFGGEIVNLSQTCI